MAILSLPLLAHAAPFVQQDGDYIQLVNPDPKLYWCWLETRSGRYVSMWLQPGAISVWLYVGRQQYTWGCEG